MIWWWQQFEIAVDVSRRKVCALHCQFAVHFALSSCRMSEFPDNIAEYRSTAVGSNLHLPGDWQPERHVRVHVDKCFGWNSVDATDCDRFNAGTVHPDVQCDASRWWHHAMLEFQCHQWNSHRFVQLVFSPTRCPS